MEEHYVSVNGGIIAASALPSRGGRIPRTFQGLPIELIVDNAVEVAQGRAAVRYLRSRTLDRRLFCQAIVAINRYAGLPDGLHYFGLADHLMRQGDKKLASLINRAARRLCR